MGASGWEVGTNSVREARTAKCNAKRCCFAGFSIGACILFVFVLLPLLVGADPIIPFPN